MVHVGGNSSPFRGPRAIAAGQGNAISAAQLHDAGFDGEAIKYRVRTGWLEPVHRGVYSIGELTPAGRLWSAVLATDGALSHASAAAVWDLLPWPSGRIEIATLTHRRSTAAIRVHRPRTLTLDDITRDPRHGLPVTRVKRLLIDMTPRLTPHRLERFVHRAEHLRILDVPDPCPRRLRIALDTLALGPPQITRSELEERFLELVAHAGLPRPLVNHERGDYTCDFVWPEPKLIVETDGARTHNTDSAFVADRRRDVNLKLAGWDTLRFTWYDVVRDPAWTQAALRKAWSRYCR